MARTPTILDSLRTNPTGVRFTDLAKVCDEYFGEPRQKGTSHRIYKRWIPARQDAGCRTALRQFTSEVRTAQYDDLKLRLGHQPELTGSALGLHI